MDRIGCTPFYAKFRLPKSLPIIKADHRTSYSPAGGLASSVSQQAQLLSPPVSFRITLATNRFIFVSPSKTALGRSYLESSPVSLLETFTNL